MSQRSITVRPARTEDAKLVAAFNRAMALETEHKDLVPEVALRGVMVAINDASRARYYLAEIGGVVAGQTMVTVEWSDWRAGFFWWIQSVYVKPRFRRLGVFRALHEYIRREAQTQPDVCGLRLYVHNENSRALATYARLGMHATPYLVCEEEWTPGKG